MNPERNMNPGTRPRVLLTDSNRWALSARLAMGLSDAGCEVLALCPTPGHSLSITRAVRRIFPYSGLRPIASLMSAIESANPDIIVPCCERSLGHLHELYLKFQAGSVAQKRVAELIERSLGAPSSHAVVVSRYRLLELAKEEGIRVPQTRRVQNQAGIASWRLQEPLPWVLKVDGTWGGGGVRIVRTPEDAAGSMTQIAGIFRFRRAVKRSIVNRDLFDLRAWWKGAEHEYSVQSYIEGRPANCAVLCWKGRVFAGLGVEVMRSDGATGPANVVRVVENSEMMLAAEKIASRLCLTGFFGLDFVIEEGSGLAYLIEMNPRTTPLCHLRLGTGRDMIAAMCSQLTGQPCVEATALTQKELIAYFPQDEQSLSGFPQECFYDIPLGEPELVKDMLNPFPNRTFLFRLFESFIRKPQEQDAERRDDLAVEVGRGRASEESLFETAATSGNADPSSRSGRSLDLR